MSLYNTALEIESQQQLNPVFSEKIIIAELMAGYHKITDISIKEHHFMDKKNKELFKTICEYSKIVDCSDFIGFFNFFKQKLSKDPDISDYTKYIVDISILSTGNIQRFIYCSNILVDNYIRRELNVFSDDLKHSCFNLDVSIIHTIERITKGMKSLVDDIYTDGMTWKEHVETETEDFKERIRKVQNGETIGITWQSKQLTEELGEKQKGDLIIIAGRPGMCKTSFSLDSAIHSAMNGYKPYIAELEMPTKQLVQKTISGHSDINNRKFISGYNLTEYEWKRYNETVDKIARLNINIDDKLLYIPNIISKIRTLHANGNVDEVYIDYLGLSETDKASTKDLEIGQITKSLKSLAKELSIPITLLCQLSRRVEERTSKIPQLSDLRDSGNIEQDADIVLFLYRPSYYGFTSITAMDNIEVDETDFIIIVGKHRNGGSMNDMIRLKTNEFKNRFFDFTPELPQITF